MAIALISELAKGNVNDRSIEFDLLQGGLSLAIRVLSKGERWPTLKVWARALAVSGLRCVPVANELVNMSGGMSEITDRIAIYMSADKLGHSR